MANILPRDKQEQAIHSLLEGMSVRSTERLTGIHRDTILRLMCRVGEACSRVMDETMRGLSCERVQVDELWGFIGKKQRHVRPEDDQTRCGDVWTFVALDADTKIVPTYLIGKRTKESATVFMRDLASRLDNRVQLSSDGLSAYVDAVEEAFGADVDYGQIVKHYEAEPVGPGRYSPPKVTKTVKTVIMGQPDRTHISTSYIERQNLTMRMSMRRLTRLTNAFSKKLENFEAAVSLYFAYYNFVRIHTTLRVTPAMEAGLTNRLWSVGDLIDTASN
jgi:IS1 family transposase